MSPPRKQKSEKPIVFLSHSSKDKEQLALLKQELDGRFGNSVTFFLSSDGESIPFGANWVSEISDALANARLMFLFLSRNSVDSKWVHFEAGHSYGNNIHVVPVCLPGLDLNEITAPLGHLQGFNLHSEAAMGNLIEIINNEFELRMDKAFTLESFRRIFAPTILEAETFFGRWGEFVSFLRFQGSIEGPPASTKFEAISELETAFKETGVSVGRTDFAPHSQQLEAPGALLRYRTDYAGQENSRHTIEGTFAPELLHLYVPGLDLWNRRRAAYKVEIVIWFDSVQVIRESPAMTAKLYQSEIHVATSGQLDFRGLKFRLPWDQSSPTLGFAYESELGALPLRELLGILFQRRVLTVKERGVATGREWQSMIGL